MPEKERYAGQTERPGTKCNRSLSPSTSEGFFFLKPRDIIFELLMEGPFVRRMWNSWKVVIG